MKIKTCYYQEFDPEDYVSIIIKWYVYPRKNNCRKLNLLWYTNSEILEEIKEFWSDILINDHYVNEVTEEMLNQLMKWTVDHYKMINDIANNAISYIDENDKWLYNLEETIRENQLKKYSDPNYKAPKNAKEVTYKGKTYKSKAQCCVIENITLTQLNNYLK
jgi:hypothetical protein